jgi:hypothetical protein
MRSILVVVLLLVLCTMLTWIVIAEGPRTIRNAAAVEGNSARGDEHRRLTGSAANPAEDRGKALDDRALDPDVEPQAATARGYQTTGTARIAKVSGRCLDAGTGRPLRGCSVSFAGWNGSFWRSTEISGSESWNNPSVVVTDVDGKFEFAFVPPREFRFRLVATARGRETRSQAWDGLEPGTRVDVGDLSLPEVPAEVSFIAGVVTDQDGHKLAGVEVGGTRDFRSPRLYSTQTGDDGRFVLRRIPYHENVRVIVGFSADGFEPFVLEDSVAWGEHKVRVRMRRTPGVELRVTDASTGKPVRQFGIRCFPDAFNSGKLHDFSKRPWASYLSDVQHKGHHVGGTVRLSRVLRGRNIVVVEPLNPSYASSGLVTFNVEGDDPPPIEVEIRRAQERIVDVRDLYSREPVRDVTVRLFRHHPSVPTSAGLLPARWLYDQPAGLLVQQSKTDARGQVVVIVDPTTNYHLTVSGPTLPRPTLDVVRPIARDIRHLRGSTDARRNILVGVVLGSVELQGRVLLNGVPLRSERIMFNGPQTSNSYVRTDAAGFFKVRTNPDLFVRFHHRRYYGASSMVASSLVTEESFAVRTGADNFCDVQLSSGQLRVRLLSADGYSPLAGIPVRVRLNRHIEFVRRTDEDGELFHPAVSPGRWKLWVWPKDVADHGKIQNRGSIRPSSQARIPAGTVFVHSRAASRIVDLVLDRSSGY